MFEQLFAHFDRHPAKFSIRGLRRDLQPLRVLCVDHGLPAAPGMIDDRVGKEPDQLREGERAFVTPTAATLENLAQHTIVHSGPPGLDNSLK